MSPGKEVVRGLKWGAAARFISQAVTWLITLVVIRLLQPSDYGLVALASLFVGFASLMAEAGLGAAVVQAHKVDEATLQRVLSLMVVVDVGLYLALLPLGYAAAWFFSEPLLWPVIALQGLQLPIAVIGAISDAKLQRELEFKRRSLIELGSVVCGSLLTLVMAMSGAGVWALVSGTLSAATLRSLAFALVSPFRWQPRFDFAGLGALVAFGRDWTIARLLWFFYSQADVFIAGRILGKDLLGYYSVAMQIASLPAQKVAVIINQVIFPVFARLQSDPRHAGQYILEGMRLLALAMLPVFWGLSSVAPELVLTVLGQKWELVVIPLQLIALVMPGSLILSAVNTAVQGLGHGPMVLRNVVTGTIVMPIAFLIGCQWGLLGISIAWLVAFPIVFLVNLSRTLPLLSLDWMTFLGAFWRPAACALLMSAAVAAVRLAYSPSGVPGLIALVLTGASTYALVAWLLDRNTCVALVRTIRGR